MKIKLIQPNSYGRLEFSIEELEELLKETYDEGYADGLRSSTYATKATLQDYYPSITLLNSSTDKNVMSVSNSTTSEVALG